MHSRLKWQVCLVLLFGLTGCLLSEAPNEKNTLGQKPGPPPPALEVQGALSPSRHVIRGGAFEVRGTLTPGTMTPRRSNTHTLTPARQTAD